MNNESLEVEMVVGYAPVSLVQPNRGCRPIKVLKKFEDEIQAFTARTTGEEGHQSR